MSYQCFENNLIKNFLEKIIFNPGSRAPDLYVKMFGEMQLDIIPKKPTICKIITS